MSSLLPVIPPYFDSIANSAAQDWNQLEDNPRLAGPWRLLFKQIQSPRHVLSELLQNAEDAEATWARASTQGDTFVFEHNGRDFDRDTLASLCRFGHSNKTSLHTIGFRGVGFKTLFSLGPTVTLQTPTLALSFSRRRFTEPLWMAGVPALPHTCISVRLTDDHAREALESSLQEWVRSPVPLLFFDSLQSIAIQDRDARKRFVGDGPVPGSQWLELESEGVQRILRVSSDAQTMPEEALAEIREERGDEQFNAGDCRVDILLGISTENRLYAVLPTQVAPPLPFSCNAPFLQDPSRFRIKDPSVSPTNRWLLNRIGKLAATTLRLWLHGDDLPVEQRVAAYGLLPARGGRANSELDAAVHSAVCESIGEVLDGESLALAHDRSLRVASACADIPPIFLRCWGPSEALQALAPYAPSAVHPQVDEASRQRLAEWGFLKRVVRKSLLDRIAAQASLPRPESDADLLSLWATVKDMEKGNPWRRKDQSYPLVPLQGSRRLVRVRGVLRVGVKDERLSEADAHLLYSLVSIADDSFLSRFERRSQPGEDLEGLGSALLYHRDLSFEPSSMQRAFDLACQRAFGSEPCDQETRLRLLRVAVLADLSLPADPFRYLCRDQSWQPASVGLFYGADEHGDLLPPDWIQSHGISDLYSALFAEAETKKLADWLASSKSRLHSFPMPREVAEPVHTWREVEQIASRRGGSPPDASVASAKRFRLHDYDWDISLHDYWRSQAQRDPEIWAYVVEACARAWGSQAESIAYGKVVKFWRNTTYTACEGFAARWLMVLRDTPCLWEEKSLKVKRPSELLRRTPETEAVLHTEQFVSLNIDRAYPHPLLDLLGVRSEANSAGGILRRLSALSQSSAPPITHLLDLYRALDGVWPRLSAGDREAATVQLASEPLVYDSDGDWHRADDPCLFQANPERIPGVSTIHLELLDLSLWDMLEIPRLPSLDVVLQWLPTLPSEAELSEADRRRLHAILSQAPRRALDTCGHWISCAGTWEPIGDLSYYVADRSSVVGGVSALFKQARSRVADFRMVRSEEVDGLRGHLRPLGVALEQQVDDQGSRLCPAPEWLRPMTTGLLRIRTLSAESIEGNLSPDDRAAAVELYRSVYARADELTLCPYLDGVQVGTRSPARAVWLGGVIYVAGPEPTHHRPLVDALEARFGAAELKDVIRDCVGKSKEWIEQYLATTYALRPLAEVEGELNADLQGAPGPKGHGTPCPDRAVPLSGALGAEGNGDHSLSEAARGAVPLVLEQNPNGGAGHPGDLADEATTAHRSRSREQTDPLRVWLETYGFAWDTEASLYRHTSGSVVRREAGSRFWTLYGANGNTLCAILVVNTDLEAGFELSAPDWRLLELHASTSVIVGRQGDGAVATLSTKDALRMRDRNELTVSVPSYRFAWGTRGPASDALAPFDPLGAVPV